MFRHKGALISTSVVLLLFATAQAQSNSRSYDTNDWIPVSRSCPTCFQNEDTQSDGVQKRPTGRVLNLPTPDQKQFFPQEQSESNPQSYNIPLKQQEEKQQQPQQQQQARLLQNQGQYPQPQIVLPPQLQSLINQGQPFLSPQRINNQLLQAPNGIAYQPTLQTVPQFALNSTQFNSRDVVQNINLGLYNQQSTNQQPQITQPQNIKPNANNDREEVQLLYVPLENLRQRGQRQQIAFPSEQRLPAPQAYNQPAAQQYQPVQHKQAQLQNIQQDFVQQALQAQKLQEQFQHNISPVPQQNFRRPYVPDPITHEPTTTPAPKKRKPHQPPLAVYMGTEGHSEIKLGDVLTLLKDAKTISVQDNIGPNAPQVFVGPSHLAPPDGYVKFDLPYLSSIESNRVERKVDQLPFFVAPLSYKAPPGYSKIPFPAPHVGSVVINHIQANSQEQTTTENVQHFLNQNIQEASSHTPYSSAEITTVRTRGRQRQPSRASYAASTVQTPVTPEIPYGPLPTKVPPSAEQQHSVQESLISPNPYGPTQFVQSTTPSIYENPASLPQQIFSTKNRFSTPNYNVHNVQSNPERHNQFIQQVQQVQEVESTEHTPLATTPSDVISDDKYTVLEQFPLPEKSSSNKYSQTNVAHNTPQKVPSRHHSRGRPTENYYNDGSKTETPLSLVSNEQYSNEQYLVEAPVKSPYLQNQQEIPGQQYVTQAVPTKQIPLEHYSHDTKKPTAQEPLVQHQYESQEIPNKEIPLEHYNHQQQHIVQESPVQHYSAERPHHDEILANQQYSTEQTSAEYEKSERQSRPHSRVRGKQHFTPEPYYKEEYETPNVKETSTRHEPSLNQQIVQYQTSVYDSREQELPVSTQATRGKGRPEHIPETYFKEDYVSQNINEAPVRHEVALNKQVNEQPTEYVSQEIQLQKHQLQKTRGRDYDSQEISLQQVNPQVTRGRGKPQLSPETYRQEYEQHNVKPTEPEVHVTKKPIVNYEIPIRSTQKSTELTGRPQYNPETYYRDVPEQPRVQEQQQQYTLPSQLPPISPHLPGLVNSLQDQAFRPLLAPLLLPPSEEPPVTEYTSEYYTTPFTTTTTTTTSTTTTPVPIVETTTQFKRTRGRQRGSRPTASYEYVNTTPSSHQRTSSYRGRRPYTRTRQQSHEKNVPVSSTAQPEVVTETSTRAAFNRNRYVQRERQYVSSTTEQPRRQPTNSRQRFRTRGRPLKTDEEYAVKSTTESVPDFKQSSFEDGFQPVDHSNAELPAQIPNNNPQFNIQNDQFLNQKQQEQALVYVQNSNKQVVPESNPIQISSEEYIPREHFISSTEIVEPLHQTTIAASAPENNIVSNVLHNEPVVLVNHKINQEQSNYPNVELNTNRNVEYNSNEDINVNTPRGKYIEEPEVRIQPTTESVRIRSRIRGRPRTRGYQSSSSSRYQAPSPTTTTTTTTTTQRSTTESKEEDQEEFYGFFRPPSFVKPIKMEYKPSSELRTAVNPTPTVAYLHSPTSEEQNVYVSPVGNPVYSTPATHLHVSQVDDSQADHNIRTQYVSSTPDIRTQYAPPAESSEEEEEEVVDIKPVTRRPPSSFNRTRRPIAPATVEDHTEIPSRVTEKYYTVRPTKRPETQTQKVTRIRGRIRRPTRPTTVAPTTETESSYSGNQQQHQQHYSRTNELSNTHSDEYVAPVKPRQRITNRGKSHFQLPRNEKIALEPESNNYPPSFLQAQQNHHQQAEATVNIPEASAQKSVNIGSAEEVHTAKPSFQLTIEPEEGDEEYSDQIPYTSVNKHRTDINLDEGAESKYSAKIVAKPSNYNFIVTNEKNNGNIDKTTEKPTSTETIDITTVKNEPVVTETEEPLVTFQQLTTVFPEIDITQTSESTTTDIPTTLESVTDIPQARRRGIWRLVKLRPVGDDFESAESQNIGTVLNNNFDVEKPVRKYHSVKRIRTTTEEAQEEITTVVPPKVVNNQQNDVPTPESDIFAPLYEMFGYNREGSILDNGFDILPSDDDTVTTTVLPTVNNIFSDDVELTTLTNFNTTETNQDFSSIKEEDKIEMYSDRLAKLGDKEAESSTEDSWRTRIIGTSTTTEISHETEICYRGRCVKSSSEESSERL